MKTPTLTDKINEVSDYIAEHFADPNIKWQAGISGGKDSTATYLLLMELGIDFTPCFADTGNEHPDTVKHAMTIAERTGGPEVIRLQRTFSEEDFAKRRRTLQASWAKPHRIRMGARRGEIMPAFPQDVIDEALAVLRPTGNNFFDMLLLHGMVPNRRAQFCTVELKLEPVYGLMRTWVDDGYDVISVAGIRADESKRRAEYLRHEPDRRFDAEQGDLTNFRPILDWKAEDCFAMHKRHGIEPNPLYSQGMSRVGCLPCIFENQAGLVEIHKRFPEQIERIEQWERAVAKVSRWAAFHGEEAVGFGGPKGFGPALHTMFYTTSEYIKWVGDKPKFDLDEAAPSCSSIYGLCE